MRKPVHRRERTFLRLLFGGAAALALLILCGVWAHNWYQGWQGQRFARRAQTYLKWGNSKSAVFSARQALGFDPSNVDALRVVADVMESQGSSAAVEWRQKIVASHPDSVPDSVSLAKTAVKFGALETAGTTLDRIANKAAENAGYHEALGQLAIARKKTGDAELQFQEASRLEPDNLLLRLELAAVELRSEEAGKRQSARTVLQQLLANKALRVAAARILLQDAIQRKDTAVVEFADALRGFPETPFHDRLLCLQLFAQLKLPQFASALTDAQQEAAADPEKLATLLSWMGANNLSLLALEWTKRLPPDLLQQRPVFLAVADCYVVTKDPAGLDQWCKKTKWGALDFLRHGYLAWASRASKNPINSELEWSRAVKDASGADDLDILQRAAARWGWKKESIELLWTLSNNSAKQEAALGTLYQYYGEQGDTGNLYRVAARLSRIAPDDSQAQNNLAQLSLLLNVDVERARALARQLYERHRDDANFASTYAYALYRQGQVKQAAAIMSSLSDKELRRPEIAAYYGIILSALGAREKAQPFLDLGKTARLLPEEKALLQEAIAGH